MATLQEIIARHKGGATDPYEQAQRQVENDRWRLQQMGLPDPTQKPNPSALERIFGVLDTPGAGVRALIHNATNAPNDQDVSAWGEMGKALRGENRIEGADILKDYGVEGKWQRMIGGLLFDVVTDPTTYLTFGFGGAAKASAKTALGKLGAEGALSLGKLKEIGIADDILRQLAPYADDVGKLIPDQIPRELTQQLMNSTAKAMGGKGGVKFAGIQLGGEKALSSLGFKAKDLARTIPGADLFQQAFIYGDDAAEMMKGNELVNAAVRFSKHKVSGKKAAGEYLANEFFNRLQELVPDEADRMRVTMAIGRQIKDPKNSNIIKAELEALGLTGEQLDNALKMAYQFKAESRDLLERMKAAGIDVTDFGKSYMPGMEKVSRSAKASKAYDDNLRNLGFNPDELITEGKLNPNYMKSKSYPNPEARLQGMTMDDWLNRFNERDMSFDEFKQFVDETGVKFVDGKAVLNPENAYQRFVVEGKLPKVQELNLKATGKKLSTEMDSAVLGKEMKRRAELSIAIADHKRELGNIFSDSDAVELLATTANKSFFNDDAAKGFMRLYDKTLNLWKMAATTMNFPMFPARNHLSNKFLQGIEGLLSPKAEAESVRILTNLSKGTLDEADSRIVKELIENRVLTTGKEVAELTGESRLPNIIQKMSDVNSFVENQSRVSAYLAAKNKGLTSEAAAMMVDRALYSYDPAMLTAFERNVMKRIAPFYVFSRRNTPRMIETLLTSPGKLTPISHLKESGENVTGIESSDMPSYLRNLFAIPLPNGQVLSTGGVLPISDIERVIPQAPREYAREQMSAVSPLLRDPLEILFNKDIWRDTDISSPGSTLRSAPDYVQLFDKAVQATPASKTWEAIKAQLGLQYKERPDGQQYLVMDAATAKLMKDLLPFMSGVARGFSGDQANLFSQLSGIKLVPTDTAEWQRQKVYEDRKTLQDYLNAYKEQNPKAEIPTVKKKNTIKDLLGGK